MLTNNPRYTPGDLAHRRHGIGLDVPPECIFTSALATARFLHGQRPRSTAFVIGESGLTDAFHDVGYIITGHDPEYVVLGPAWRRFWFLAASPARRTFDASPTSRHGLSRLSAMLSREEASGWGLGAGEGTSGVLLKKVRHSMVCHPDPAVAGEGSLLLFSLANCGIASLRST